MRSEITGHLHRNDIITVAQQGFRKRRSCETQLILKVEDLAGEIDKGGQAHIILLDFSKAFDKVTHKRLLLRLYLYGTRGKTKRRIEDFLSNRTLQILWLRLRNTPLLDLYQRPR